MLGRFTDAIIHGRRTNPRGLGFQGGCFCVDCAPGNRPAAIRRNGAAGLLVDSAARRVPRTVDLHLLLDVGGVPGRSLQLRTVSLALLFSGNIRKLTAQLVWSETGVLARVAPVLACAADP